MHGNGDGTPEVLGAESVDLPRKSITPPDFISLAGAKPPNPEAPALGDVVDDTGGAGFFTAASRLKFIARELLLDDDIGSTSIDVDTTDEVTRSSNAIGDRNWKFFGPEQALKPPLLHTLIGKLKVNMDMSCNAVLASEAEPLLDVAVEPDDTMVTTVFAGNSSPGSISTSSSPGAVAA